MKRKGRSAIGKQQESCDVWLDPSALKRRKVMDVATKPAFTLLGQDSHPAAIIGLPHPRTKQTTISTFFTAQKAELSYGKLATASWRIVIDPARNASVVPSLRKAASFMEDELARRVLGLLSKYQVDEDAGCSFADTVGYISSGTWGNVLEFKGDKTTDPSKQLTTSASNDVVNLKDSELRRGKRTRAPAFQPSSLQDCQRQPAKATDVSGLSFCSPLPARTQSHTSTRLVVREEDAVTERGPFLTTDLIQHVEEKGGHQQQLAAGSPLRERNDGWQKEESPTLFSQKCPGFKIIPNQRMDAGKRRRPPSSWAGPTSVDDSENMDPELEGNLPEAAYLDFNLTGVCRRYTDATSCENSTLASTQRLFTQDSEGYRVILHRLGGEGSKPSLPKEPWGGKRTPVGSSFNKKSCFREGWAGDRSPPGPLARRSLPPLTEHSEKSCYDLLFTEDSEGNRVIKH